MGDILREFLNPNKIFEPCVVPTGIVNGKLQVEDSSDEDEPDILTEENNTNYARPYQIAEEELYKQALIDQDKDKSLYNIDSFDDLSSNENIAKFQEQTEIFNKYSFTRVGENHLPIEYYKKSIIDHLNSNSVLIIQGPTGCGKTTQVPQYILDYCRENNQYCNIVVTQPRRIAAVSVARRVCAERGWALGTVCGYQVALERCKSSDTILSYVTTGVLLQSLIKVKSLQNYTHIIVDEVHERSQEMDFLLVLIRKFLYTNSPNTKVILMSATLDTVKFQNYFKTNCSDIDIYPPTLHVLKESNFNNQLFYIDQLSTLGEIPDFSVAEPRIDKCLYDILIRLIRIFDRLDKPDIKTNIKIVGSVLVFLPGIYEIEEAYNYLMNGNAYKVGNSEPVQWYILPLHSSITNEEQRKVFIPPQPGFRKIILSTNIAESSITVPDITYVIDFCLTKTMVVHPETKYESLELQWATHVNCTQRAGRVGRVTDGRVYRFVTTRFYEDMMNKDVTPEILRAPLDRIVLATKLLELDDPPKAILALLIDPPNLGNIESTIWGLKEVGGLALTCRGVRLVSDGDLTYLGRVMCELPLNVNLAKLIFLGHIFSCLKDCIIMATGCSLSNVFSSPFQEKILAYLNRLQWADGSCSDLISYLNLFKVWQHKKRTNAFSQSSNESEANWARQNYINKRALNEWNILVNEITQRCANLGIKESVGQARVTLDHIETPLFLKVAMCGAFYPNYFKRSSDAGQIDEREAVKVLGGKDPCKTVYFKQMNHSQPGPLYARRIKELFPFCTAIMNIFFDNSYRVYVEFTPTTTTETVQVDGRHFVTGMPGKICKEVYCAVRRRQLRMPNIIHCLPARDSWKLAYNYRLCEKTEGSHFRLIKKPRFRHSNCSVLPDMDIQFIKICVSVCIDAGHFWAQNVDDETADNLQLIQKHLNSNSLANVPREEVKTDEIYAAMYDDNFYYRCKVIENTYLRKENAKIIQVIFIDYGDIRSIQINKLCQIPAEVREIPPQAMECVLSEVQPSIVQNPIANMEFEKFTKDTNLYGKVYSVVNNIVHLELFKELPHDETAETALSLNKYLIEKGLAQKAEESFLSKENHVEREKLRNSESVVTSSTVFESDNFIESQDVEPPNKSACTTSFQLKGPYSPLEMNIFSVMASGLEKTVSVEGTSVNSVLLDTDPQDPHERLIVAVTVAESASSRSLHLRHTTVMPNIHGFSVLMALLFCPTMEPKPVSDGSRFGAVLCGLGAHENTNRSMYPAHDMVFTLDTELTQTLLNEINEIRYWMNVFVRTMDCISDGMAASLDIETCQREIKDRLLATLKKPRRSVERVYVKYANIWHKLLYNGGVLESGEHGAMANDIWPLHRTIALKEESEQTAALKENLRDMTSFATKKKPMSEITCKLCNVALHTIPEVRLHLASKGHADKVQATVPDAREEH